MAKTKTKEINVNILGKGEEKVKVEEAETVGDSFILSKKADTKKGRKKNGKEKG